MGDIRIEQAIGQRQGGSQNEPQPQRDSGQTPILHSGKCTWGVKERSLSKSVERLLHLQQHQQTQQTEGRQDHLW
jgi:hypothetical protein